MIDQMNSLQSALARMCGKTITKLETIPLCSDGTGPMALVMTCGDDTIVRAVISDISVADVNGVIRSEFW